MGGTPQELRTFLAARTPGARDDAWAAFLHRFSPLLLHTARSVASEYDLAMDAYAHVLERLQANDGARLRQYAEDPRSRFTTWLVVVARRSCVDFLRQRYGRTRGANEQAAEDRAARRRLVDLVGADLDVEKGLADKETAADEALEASELRAALGHALASLEPRQRLLLALRYEDGLAAREIAQRLNLPTPFHVYRGVETALRALRAHLASKGFGDPAA